MKVGVTATAEGLTPEQELGLAALLVQLGDGDDWLLHGCCIGGDAQLWEIARHRLGWRTHGHPGRGLTDPARAITFDDLLDPVPSTKTPELTRNRLIVARSEVLLVGPSGYREKRRSGTWATYRYAVAAGLPLIIVYPDGTQNMEFAGIFAPGSTRSLSAQRRGPVS